MSSGPKDDNVVIGDGIHIVEQGQSQKVSPSGSNEEKTPKGDIETMKSTPEPEPTLEVNKSEVVSSTELSAVVSPIQQPDDIESEDIKSIPSTSTVSIQAESYVPKSTGSADAQPLAGRILLKRRRSRISMPTLIGPMNVTEEVDSAPPRSTRRRSQKKQMVALFSESDYPRRK